jgi:glycosyltransferase involved in cell wall biosynthesis
MTNLEAAACGTPTLASDSPGLRESVAAGVTGELLPHGDPVALAAAMRGLVEQPGRRDAMARAAREFACGFSWNAAADRTERHLLNQLEQISPSIEDASRDCPCSPNPSAWTDF